MGLQLQAVTQTSVSMLCLAGLHVHDALERKNKHKIENVGKIKNVKHVKM